ncbi:TetR family transcriptional regulator [Hypericibacter sp.]|uniref:TetR family transcriptional regulator n=1 Tax=Hypericibacter sp. TaxID=2705401 RepID=UPI003D6C8A15
MARRAKARRGGGKAETGTAQTRARARRKAGPRAAKLGDSGAANADSLEEAVVAAAMALAERQPWTRVTLGDIAEEAGLPLAALMLAFPSKTAVLTAFQRGIDRAVLQAGEVGEGSARDRLFELLMRRLEALKPHRKALASIAAAAPHDPVGVICGWSRLLHSMSTALALAGLSADGLQGMIRLKGLAGLYGSVLPVFLRDDSDDLTRTMAALDGRLQRIETVINWFRGRIKPET